MTDLHTKVVDISSEPVLDWSVLNADLESDNGLETAVILSLYTDGLANDDDPLPGRNDDRRGWWGDAWPEIPGDRIGSRLWLLSREKQTADILIRAREYALEALAWLVDDGVARRVDAVATSPVPAVLTLAVSIERPVGPPVKFRFDDFWRGR